MFCAQSFGRAAAAVTACVFAVHSSLSLVYAAEIVCDARIAKHGMRNASTQWTQDVFRIMRCRPRHREALVSRTNALSFALESATKTVLVLS